jgi:hypothetical protein
VAEKWENAEQTGCFSPWAMAAAPTSIPTVATVRRIEAMVPQAFPLRAVDAARVICDRTFVAAQQRKPQSLSKWKLQRRELGNKINSQ